ncbi:hypothetical protein INS49_013633 [Diaporthe citri]|uniref:uncharacterized protein n=1 Tax=Diaporthe citri TaxID=83186 RepID=UPI001C812376|nr:uncharacterized protein INS49_013633 [Diaporthe citri]KAG6357754.1 hypothetical protein INS49_013633 [Diaporthe citri]
MDENSLLQSDEPQSLSALPSRISAEDMELPNHSHDGSVSLLSALTSTTNCNRNSGDQREAAPAYTPIYRQLQPHLGVHHQDDEPPFQSDKCVHRLWLWEILSITVAALALVAIVITLVLHRDHPLPKWPSAITINALIAVFTAVFKACLMMPIAEAIGQLKWLWYQKSRPLRHMEHWDLASRGPWGSMLLIFLLKSQNLAVIGAILTVVAMAVDAFTQQVVQFYSCPTVVDGERATVPFSNNYTADFWGTQSDPQMQSATYVGLIDPPANISAALKFEYKTGNCTFPSTDDGVTFMSLALESRCTDIGKDVAFSTGTRNFTDSVFGHETNPKMATVNAILPSYKLQLNNYSSNVMQSGSRASTSCPSHFLRQVAFLTMSSRWGYRGEPQDSHAFECGFYPAVNTYSANITNGVLFEQVLDSQRMDYPQARLIVNRTIREGKWHECTGNPGPSDENNVPVDIDFSVHSCGSAILSGNTPEEMTDPSYNITWWAHDCVYSLDLDIAEGLSEAISGLLGTGTLSYDWAIEHAKGDPWSVNLWNNGAPTLDTVQAIMDGMTRSVTARLRQGNGIGVNMGPANGTVWGMQTCVGVNWGWLALPAGLLLLTILFLVLSIIRTSSRQARVWKSSIFAVLFSGLDQVTRKSDGPVVSLEEMKAAADRATVRLEDTKEGFRLVGQA